jgi:hypothetical protein
LATLRAALGHFFTASAAQDDRATYALSGIGSSRWLRLRARGLTATTQVPSLCAIFFIASAAASSAYLTVSDFSGRDAAVSISLFYRRHGRRGFIAPALFGVIVESGNREAMFGGFTLAALLMRGGDHRGGVGVDVSGSRWRKSRGLCAV